MSTDVPIDNRLTDARAQHRQLLEERDGLRRFMESMASLVAAVESPRAESEAMELLADVLDSLIRAVGARDGSLLAPDASTRELVFVLLRGEAPNFGLIGRRVPPGAGIAGWVAENRQATIVNNAAIDDRFYSEMDCDFDYRTSSVLAAPLIGGGKLLGVVEVVNKQDRKLFSIGNQTLLTLMSRFAGELLVATIKDVDLTQERVHPPIARAR